MDEKIRAWAANAARSGGGFIQNFAGAVLRADVDNYEILMPAIEPLMLKYPEYLTEEWPRVVADMGLED